MLLPKQRWLVFLQLLGWNDDCRGDFIVSFRIQEAASHFLSGDIEALNLGALFVGCLPNVVACLQIVPKTDVGSERIR